MQETIAALHTRTDEFKDDVKKDLTMATAEIDNVKNTLVQDFMKTKEDLRQFAASLWSTVADGAAGDGNGGRKTSLLTMKETTVDRLPDDVSKADFDNWVGELYVHLERVDGWAGTSSLLWELRHEKFDLTEDSLRAIITKVHEAEDDFDYMGFNVKKRDHELYAS